MQTPWFAAVHFHFCNLIDINDFTFFIDVPNNNTGIQFGEIARQLGADTTTSTSNKNNMTRNVLKSMGKINKHHEIIKYVLYSMYLSQWLLFESVSD